MKQKYNVAKAMLYGCLAVALLLSWTGCSKKLRIELWNNTKAKVTVSIDTEQIPLAPGAKEFFLYPRPAAKKFTVAFTDRILKFTFQDPPPSYRKETRTMTLYIMQLHTNDCIYLLQQTATGPSSNLEDQPAGFPLRPEMERQ